MKNRFGEVNNQLLFKEQFTGEKLVTSQPKRINQKFLPSIPWNLLAKTALISPATGLVFFIIWYYYKVLKTNTIRLPNKKFIEVGISPTTKIRSLKKLEEAGLLKIKPQETKKSVEITLTIESEL
jgi:hypothetical protein